jgi:hypothetical protein
MTGTYRQGDKSNDAEYLVLHKDTSYLRIKRSSVGGESVVTPFNVVRSFGKWSETNGELVLRATSADRGDGGMERFRTEKFRDVAILQPLLGANWTGPDYTWIQSGMPAFLSKGIPTKLSSGDD